MTKQQREHLRAILQQAITDSDIDGVIGTKVREEMERFTREAGGAPNSYASRIQQGREQAIRQGELPEAARILGSIGLIQAASAGRPGNRVRPGEDARRRGRLQEGTFSR